jgi:hypothetical protein
MFEWAMILAMKGFEDGLGKRGFVRSLGMLFAIPILVNREEI